jgi:hypothetical protein
MIRNGWEQDAVPGTSSKWFNSPVMFHEGSLTDVRKHIPAFERRAFGLTQPDNEQSRLNERLDTIVRLPIGDDMTFIPVGVVSKSYTLVQHDAVLDVVDKALYAEKIEPDDVKAELEITEYGERMALSVYLPDKYDFDPGDGNSMALRLECLNSVDGSTRFRALMGWFRFVCHNGLILGVTRSDVRRRHSGDVRLEDVGVVLTAGLKESETEKKSLRSWLASKITLERLAPWVDNVLREGWGFKAAARTFHVARTGFDARVVGQHKDSTPTSVAMQGTTTRIPGAPEECRNLFDLSQILAWLAKERRGVQEQLQWREKIPDLMKPLMN